MNDKLFKFLEERGDYSFPHAKETVDNLFRLARFGQRDRSTVTQELFQLLLTDPGFAFNFARFSKEEGKPLDVDKPPSLQDAINAHDPFFIVSNMAAYEGHAQVFSEYPRIGSVYRRIAGETTLHAKRLLGEVAVDQSCIAVFMVLSAVLPSMAIASMVPALAWRVLVAGEQVDCVAEEILGFRLSELAPYLDEKYGVPRSNNPAYPAATRATAREAQLNLRIFLKHPHSKVA